MPDFNDVESILQKLPVRRKGKAVQLTSISSVESEPLLEKQEERSHQEAVDAKFQELVQARKNLQQDEQAILDLQNKVFWLLKATQEAILNDKKEKDKKISAFAMTNQMNIFLDTLLFVDGEGVFTESEIEAIRAILTADHRSGDESSERWDRTMSIVYTLCNVLDAVGLCLGWSVDGIADIVIAGSWNMVDSAGTGVQGMTQSVRERRLAGAVALTGVVTMLACTIWAAVEYFAENNAEFAAQLCGVSFAVAMLTSCAAELIHRDACVRHKAELIDELCATLENTEFFSNKSIADGQIEVSRASSSCENSHMPLRNKQNKWSLDTDMDSQSLISVDLQSQRDSKSPEIEQETKNSLTLKETILALKKESNSVIIVREGVKILKAIASELEAIGQALARTSYEPDSDEYAALKNKYIQCQEKYNKCSALLDSIAIENAQAKNHGRAAASWAFCGVAMSLSAVSTFIAFPPAAAIVSNILNVVTAVFRHAVKHGADDVKNVTQAIQKKNLLLADMDRAVNSERFDKSGKLISNNSDDLNTAIDNLNAMTDNSKGGLEGKIPEIASTFRNFYRAPNAKNLAKAAQASVTEVGKAMHDAACSAGKLMGKYLLPTKKTENENTKNTQNDNDNDQVLLLIKNGNSSEK